MPQTAAWVDELREVFGLEEVNKQIRQGMTGKQPVFHACEGGYEIGTAFTGGIVVSGVDIAIPVVIEEKRRGR